MHNSVSHERIGEDKYAIQIWKNSEDHHSSEPEVQDLPDRQTEDQMGESNHVKLALNLLSNQTL